MKKQAHLIYFDMIRVFACIMVICIHISAMDFAKFDVTTDSWMTLNVVNCIGMNGVPLFFMLSGALLLNDNYIITFKKLLRKVLKLLVIYYIGLFIFNLVPFLYGWIEWTPYMIKEALIEGMMYESGVYHLWFLPVMMVIYLLLPILKEAFSKPKICEYFLLLFFLGESILFTMTLFEYNGAIKRFVVYCQQKNTLFPLGAYIGYFVLGHYLHSFIQQLSRKKVVLIGLTTLFANLFTIMTCYFDSVRNGSPSSLTNTPLALGVLISSSGIFVLMKQYCNQIEGDKKKKILRYIANCTLGIYLLHPMIMQNVSFIQQMGEVINYVFILIIFRLICVSVISLVIVILIKGLWSLKRLYRKENC